jgi:hypothetical protein
MSVQTTPEKEPSLFDPKPPVSASAAVLHAEPEPVHAEKPASEKAAGEKAASKKAAAKAAAAKEAAGHEGAGEDAAAKQAAADAVADREAVVEEAVVKEAVVEEAVVEEAEAGAAEQEADAHSADVEALSDEASEAAGEEQEPKNDRKRLAEQLDALRRKEAELLRALAVADHPDLADAIRTIEARVYGVTRADAKIAQGLSKSEARRQETLTKKVTALREKRAELDTQIGGLEAELEEIGAARLTDFQRERHDALQALMVALATHDSAIGAAGLDVRSLLPEIGGLLPELEAIARSVSETRAGA